MQPFTFDDFSGGLDTTSGRGKSSDTSARKLVNLRSDALGKFSLTRDHSLYYTPAVSARRIYQFFNATSRALVYSTATTIAGPNYSISAIAVPEPALAGPFTLGSVTIPIVDVPVNLREDIQFASFGQAVFISIPGERLRVWYGNTAVIGTNPEIWEYAGMPAAGFGPTATIIGATGSGNLKAPAATAPIPYIEYCFTLVNAEGIEGNPSPLSNRMVPDSQSITVEVFLTPAGPPYYNAGNVSKAYIYRRGAFITDGFYRVGEKSFAGAGPYIFTDNISDIDISVIKLSNNRFMPPKGLDIIFSENRRLWGASSQGLGNTGNSTTLYASGLDAPECFGQLLDNDVTGQYGFTVGLPGLADDGIVTINSTGNMKVIGRKSSVYVVFGNSYNDIAIFRRANVGVINRRAMVRAENDVYFFGTNRRVYRITEKGIEWVSRSIHKELGPKGLSIANDLTGMYMRYFDSQVFLIFPAVTAKNPDGFAWVLDLASDTPSWRNETGLLSYDACVSNIVTSDADTNESEMLFTTGAQVKSAFAIDPLAAGKTATWRSPDIGVFSSLGVNEITPQWYSLEGVMTPGTLQQITARLVKDGVNENYIIDTAVVENTGYDVSSRSLASFRPLYLSCKALNMEFAGIFAALEIDRGQMTADIERESRSV